MTRMAGRVGRERNNEPGTGPAPIRGMSCVARALGDVEAEARLPLNDVVGVVIVPEKSRAQLGSCVEFAESLERLVRGERTLRQDEKVGLSRAGVVAVDFAGLTDRRRDALFEDHELVEVAVGRAGDRKDE